MIKFHPIDFEIKWDKLAYIRSYRADIRPILIYLKAEMGYLK